MSKKENNIERKLSRLKLSFLLYVFVYTIYVVYTSYLMENPLKRNLVDVFFLFVPLFLYGALIYIFTKSKENVLKDDIQRLKKSSKNLAILLLFSVFLSFLSMVYFNHVTNRNPSLVLDYIFVGVGLMILLVRIIQTYILVKNIQKNVQTT
ncbi:MAG TPA: hypothetical protein EYH54_00025 [Nautiliaceae bacterium]|nr:hypothetical protein [Nautiliaceae bacterium]